MLFSDLLKLSLRMFKARTMRTLLTILGMGVGIAAIVFLVSLGYGLQEALLKKITTSDALSTLDVMKSDSSSPALDQATIDRLASIPNVEAVLPVIETQAQIRVGGVTLDSGVVVSPPRYMKLEGISFSVGDTYSEATKEVVITTGVAKAFQKNPEELLGQSVSLSLFLPKETSDQKRGGNVSVPLEGTFIISGVTTGEDNQIYASPETIGSVTLPTATKLKLKSSSSATLQGVRSEIESIPLSASSISETIDQANKVFQVLQIILMSFGAIALVVSAIGMFNTMTITLLERTEEIGIMKSIGAAPSSVSLMFIMEATLMGLLGSVIGIVLGFLGGQGINLIFNLLASNFGGEKTSLFRTPFWFLTAIIIFGAFVGFLTGVLPARKAAKTDALEALRYK
ncbi:MAG: ABC transporter permease [Candidatus Moranbacteria bacterium]|nr:ABC transporter permease [Candidatus Moranbacteria bacterium]